jgi:transposase
MLALSVWLAVRDAISQLARSDKPRKTNRGSLPAHLERIEQVVDVEDKACPCCGGALHTIGEDVSERLDVVPTSFRVLVTRRPRYGCRSCESAVVQAPAPARIVEGGIPTEALIAQVLVSKYADHVPLYRQAQIYARQDIKLDRSTLADWVGRAAWYLRPLRDRTLEELRRSQRLFADEAVPLAGNIAFRTGERLKWDDTREKFTDNSKANKLVTRRYRKPWKLA